MRTILYLLCFLPLSVFAQQEPWETTNHATKPRNPVLAPDMPLPRHIVSGQGLVVFAPGDALNFVGLAAANYEYRFAGHRGARSRMFTATVGFTPPIDESINFAWHIGPKFYAGGPYNWFVCDLQYWGALDYPRRHEPTYVYNSGGYLGLGFAHTRRKGFYWSPMFLLAVREDKSTDWRADRTYSYIGFSASFGYWFK